MKTHFKTNMNYNTKGSLDQIPFVEKRKIVEQLCSTYQKISSLDQKFRFQKKSNPKNMLSTFEILLNMMNPDHAMIIEKDYIDKSDPFWAEELWSKTTYYKYAHKAVDELLALIYE